MISHLKSMLLYLLFVTVGCAPLAALTISFALEDRKLTRDAGTLCSVPDRGSSLRGARSLGEQTAAQHELAGQLAAGDVFSPEPLPNPLSIEDSRPLGPVVAGWADWVQAHGLVSRYASIQAYSSTTDVQQLTNLCQQMEELAGRLQKAPIGGADVLLRDVSSSISDTRSRIAHLERLRTANDFILKARSEFHRFAYRECMESCKQIREKYFDVLSVSELKKLETLKLHAEFWDDYTRLKALLNGPASAQANQRYIDSFLKEHAGRNGLLDEERKIIEGLKK